MNPFTTGARDAIQVNTDGALSQTLHALSYPRVNTNITKDMNMPEETKPRWVTLGEAAEYVDVTRETLRRMIKRDKDGIPDECWRVVSVGKREFYQVDLNCLETMDFNKQGRPRKND